MCLQASFLVLCWQHTLLTVQLHCRLLRYTCCVVHQAPCWQPCGSSMLSCPKGLLLHTPVYWKIRMLAFQCSRTVSSHSSGRAAPVTWSSLHLRKLAAKRVPAGSTAQSLTSPVHVVEKYLCYICCLLKAYPSDSCKLD